MKYKQILLTRPPTGSNALQGGSDADPHPQPPLGLAYLAGVLERLPDVHVLDILDGNFSENYVYDVKIFKIDYDKFELFYEKLNENP